MSKTRRSGAFMQDIQTHIDEDKLDLIAKKRFDWERAVTEELKLLYDKIELFEDKLLCLDEEDDGSESPKLKIPSVIVLKHEIKDKFDTISSSVERICRERNTEKIATQNEITKLKERVNMLEHENDGLIDKISKLATEDINTYARSEIDAKLADMRAYCSRQIKDISTNYDQKVNNLMEEIIQLRTLPMQTIAASGAPKIPLETPKFRGLENERPVRFLSEFKKYLSIVKPNNEQLSCLISQALEGDARNWWYIYEKEVRSYDDFAFRFQERYWNTNAQRNARKKIEFGQYYPEGSLNRVNYATNLYGIAQELDLDYTEEEFVLKMSEHFERDVRHAINGQQRKDRSTLLKLLADYDNDDQRQNKKHNSQRKPQDQHRSEPQRENNRGTPDKNRSWQNRNVNVAAMKTANNVQTQKIIKPKNQGTKKDESRNNEKYESIDVLNIEMDESNSKNEQ